MVSIKESNVLYTVINSILDMFADKVIITLSHNRDICHSMFHQFFFSLVYISLFNSAIAFASIQLFIQHFTESVAVTSFFLFLSLSSVISFCYCFSCQCNSSFHCWFLFLILLFSKSTYTTDNLLQLIFHFDTRNNKRE